MKTEKIAFWRPALVLLLGLMGAADAAQTQLADAPFSSGVSSDVKPNVLFILDDSGSMDWDYMPNDSSNNPMYPDDAVGYRNSVCNRVFYDPASDYEIPKDYAGVDLYSTNQTAFTGAYPNGFYCYQNNCASSTQAKTNISTSFKANTNDTAQPAYYWKYLGAAAITPSSSACDTSVSNSSTGSMTDVIEICTDNTRRTTTCSSGGKTALWKKVLVTNTSGPSASDERQNFANWYSYYRTRMAMMKSASGRAFQNIGNTYRVGFLTIHANDGASVNAAKFAKVTDFSSAQRQTWYSKLYAQDGNNATPLRTALSVAGRYFAGKNDHKNAGMIPTQADDPMQYSCQQNFSILTTDGFWNTGDGFLIDGVTTMNNQDGVISALDANNDPANKFAISPRPIYDGATTIYNRNSASNQYRNTSSCVLGTTPTQRTVQYQRCTTPAQWWKRTRASKSASWTGWALASSCTDVGTYPNRTECRQVEEYRTSSDSGSNWTDWTSWTDMANYCNTDNSGTGRQQCRNALGCVGDVWTNTQCTNTTAGVAPLCRSNPGAWSNVGACAPVAQNGSGVATECGTANVNGNFVEYRTTTTSTDTTGPAGTGSVVGTPSSSTGSWTALSGACYAAGDPALTLPSPNPQTVVGAGPPSPPTGCSAWPCDSTSSTGGSSNSLADVAQHYFVTDLRTPALANCTGALGTDVCDNLSVTVTGTAGDPESDLAKWQHMVTFTMGLGLSGTLDYQSDYKKGTGAFAGLRSGSIGWPVPAADQPSALDDLWHAAVDGRGLYFSASNPDTVVNGLSKALSSINQSTAAAAAAATSNLEPVQGDNYAYTPKYRTGAWWGELEAHKIDLSTGVVDAGVVWSAQALLDAKTGAACDNRTLKLFRSGATNNLVDLKWNTFACDGSMLPTGAAVTTLNGTEQANFNAGKIALLGQYPNMTDGTAGATNQRAAAVGDPLLNFIRGQRGKEGFVTTSDSVNQLFRERLHVLGDIINSQPVHVRAPFANYLDAGYDTFKAANASRLGIVYVAANDGFLHAFRAGQPTANASDPPDPEGGKEVWAFMPTAVLPNVYKLADANYAANHTYLVDGTPTAADVCDAATTPCVWKTILVAGLNKGGKGYYALDVTDPLTPKALWEFNWSDTCYDSTNAATWESDCHIGYTYNNPIVTKMEDGTWVVLVASGYNNVNTPTKTGDGKGYLYVLNAMTGRIIYKIATSAGDSVTPSGLNHLVGWANSPLKNNTTVRVYGGDLLGNLWRFDINNNFPPAPNQNGREATRITTVVGSSGLPQPITTRPELADFDNNGTPIILFGTGRYLSVSDVGNTEPQSAWGVVDRGVLDPVNATPIVSPRTNLNNVVLTNVAGTYRIADCTDESSKAINGWYADLPDTGERVNVDPKLQLGTFTYISNVPDDNACNVGGYSWLNFVNYKNGCPVRTSANMSVARRLSSSLGVGLNIVRLPTGKTVVITTTSNAENKTEEAAFDIAPPTGKRVSWREISQ